jgi:hypothetical protein
MATVGTSAVVEPLDARKRWVFKTTPPLNPLQGGENRWERIGFVEGHGTIINPSFYSFVDSDIQGGKFSYRLKQVDLDGSFTYSDAIEIDFLLPEKFALYQNYPNPFNPVTKIKYEIPDRARGDNNIVSLKIYDVLGNKITTLVNEVQEQGSYEIEFNAEHLSSGTYFYQLKAGNNIEAKKLILLR